MRAPITLMALLALALCASCNAPTPNQSADRAPKAARVPARESPEYQLLTVARHGFVSHDDPELAELSAVLDTLERKCLPAKTGVDTRTAFCNIILAARDDMESHGVHEGVVELAHHLDKSIPEGHPHVASLPDIAAFYVTLRVPSEVGKGR